MSTQPGPFFGPYLTAPATDDNDTGLPALETTLTASEQLVDIDGSGNLVHAEVFNGAIPGPTFKLNVGDSVVVRLVNDLPYPTGIHWHGIELENYADGTEVTQDGALGAPLQTLGNGVPAGGTFLYKFKVTRPGVFWYHPHHHNSLNRVFKGLYGMIVVTDPLEANIVSTPGIDRALPATTDTMQLVLGDITVCRTPGVAPPAGNDTATYVDPTTLPAADRAEWLSGVTAQAGPSPKALCEVAPAGSATDDDGNPATSSYSAGFVPSGVRPAFGGTPNQVEGQTVLTNGMNVGGRLGTPAAPGGLVSLPGTPPPKGVLSGQGLRLQIVNCATMRYFRLRLTYPGAGGAGVQIPLVRIGGEGGLLDSAILEGGTTGTLNTNFDSGEILLPPATRADVVAAIPAGLPVGTVLTLWTRDYQRVGQAGRNFWAQVPTVPVMHLIVTGAKPGTPYTIVGGDVNVLPLAGTALRAPAGMPPVEDLTALPTGALLPGPASPPRPAGFVNQDIKGNTAGGVPNFDGVPGMFMGSPTYAQAPHLGSSRYAEAGQVLELTVTNSSNAHHPFHLHGFSFQLVSIQPRAGAPPGTTGTFTWPYREFRDTIDLPRQHTLTFRVRTDPRELSDEATPGGALGRWLFHCHIFFHHEQGMVSEFVVTTADGREKPNVFVGGSWAYSSIPGTATRRGRFYQTNGLAVSLTASLADGTAIGSLSYPTGVSSGDWEWIYTAPAGDTSRTEYVYITATDSDGRKDQAVFRLQVGGTDNGSDVGDPHIRTVDGKRYDFQAAGEFTLLRDREGMEIQIRQTPVETPPPITDPYSGLTACVSLNTAIAARVGSHRIAYQPVEEGRYRFFVDGKAKLLTEDGIDLGGHRVSAFDAGEESGLRVDFAHNTVLTVTPRLWASYGIRYIDVTVSNTNGDEGLMGSIHQGTWLPTLPSGATVGAMPASLHERYVALYQTFADAWRVTDQTSMFVYLPGTSTATFTDRDWPPEQPPCALKPGFQKPVTPIRENIGIAKAERICRAVTVKDLHDNCVFDVATTGDETFARGYLIAQELRLHSTAVQIVGDKPQTRPMEKLTITATVLPLTHDRPRPTGTVTFLVDGVPAGSPVRLDKQGKASFTTKGLKLGEHTIRAAYGGGGRYKHHPSSSPNLLHTVGEKKETPQIPEPHGGHM
jgi:FtsP/CotA-like multicopper oxidase with cupredoxin domain